MSVIIQHYYHSGHIGGRDWTWRWSWNLPMSLTEDLNISFPNSFFLPCVRLVGVTSLIWAFICMWNQMFYFCVWLVSGVLQEITIAEFRVIENHKTKEEEKRGNNFHLQLAPEAMPRTPPTPHLERSHPCRLYLSLLSQQILIHGFCWGMFYSFNWIIFN